MHQDDVPAWLCFLAAIAVVFILSGGCDATPNRDILKPLPTGTSTTTTIMKG